jgi:hypothetical protein
MIEFLIVLSIGLFAALALIAVAYIAGRLF